MKHIYHVVSIIALFLLLACTGKEESKDGSIKLKNFQNTETSSKTNVIVASNKIDLVNKGIGPVKSVDLEDEIDHVMVERGANVFKQKCTACHRPDKKFIGPPSTAILKRRTPEWIMNMLLNPEEMLKNDPIAKALLKEYYGNPMIDQNLTHEEARAILEYYRTLE